MEPDADLSQLLHHPTAGDHMVQTWQDETSLAESVGEYIGAGLRAGEAALIVATPRHVELFRSRLSDGGMQARFLDAEQCLGRFMLDGMPDWKRFHETVGGL